MTEYIKNPFAWVGAIFSLLVVGLLIVAHYSEDHVPPLAQRNGKGKPLLDENNEPLLKEWIHPIVRRARRCVEYPPSREEFLATINHMEENGFAFAAVEEGPCGAELCEGRNSRGEVRHIPCKKGYILFTAPDGDFDYSSEAGLAFTPERKIIDWATVMVPPRDMLKPEDPNSRLTVTDDLWFSVQLHEAYHAVGPYDHVYTSGIGPFSFEPTGHIMHHSFWKGGLRDEGLAVAEPALITKEVRVVSE